MDRDIPNFNRAVMDRIYAKNHQLHLKRLKNIKSSISSTKPYLKPPTTYLVNSNIGVNYHTKLPQYNNLKKQVAIETKNAQIQRQNAILLQKMIKIMKRPDKNNDPALNKQRTSINISKQRMSMQFSKINQQNRALFHRLQSQRPTIDNKKLQQQRVKNLNILKFLGKYPNYEAISKTHNKSFELKSRRMNSTSNRPFYNQQEGRECYEVTPYMNMNEDDDLIEFHNDKEQRRVKLQHYDGRIGRNKLSATMTGFSYNRRVKQACQSNTNNSRVVNESQITSKIEIYQPIVPNRRRYLSQNQPRQSQHNSQANQHQTSMEQDGGFHAYHLNHPSYNVVIEDQNAYNKCKKWNNIKRNNNNQMPSQTDNNETNFNKKVGKIQHQRRLNSKNSQQNIFTLNQQLHIQKSNIQGNLLLNNNFNSQTTEPVPIPRFQLKGKILNKNMVDIINEDNILQQDEEYRLQRQSNNNKNVILLYKSVVELRSLLLQQQKEQLLRDIYEQMNHQGGSDDEIVEIPMRLLNWMLCQLPAEISIQRLFDSYKISIYLNPNNRITSVNKNRLNNFSGEQQQQLQSSIIEKQFDRHLIECLRNIIIQRMEEIVAVQIPEDEGSILLEDMDYDYKEFIKTMVRIEKDSEREEDQYAIYRLAIVLDNVEREMHNNNQQDVNVSQQDQNNDVKGAQNIDETKGQDDNFQQRVEANNQQQQSNESAKQQQQQDDQQQQQHSQQQQRSEQQENNHAKIGQNEQNKQQQQQQQSNNLDTSQGQNCVNHNYVQALDEQLQ